MPTFFRLEDRFPKMMNAADWEAEEKIITHEIGMAEDLIVQLNHVKEVPARTERDAILRNNLCGKHEQFAIELFDVYEAPDRESGNVIIDRLIKEMEDYIKALTPVRDAGNREDANKLLEKLIEIDHK